MKHYIVLIFLFFAVYTQAQNEQLAQDYYEKGEFEKALFSYEELFKAQPNNTIYFTKLIDCYQQLKRFDDAIKLLKPKIEKQKQYQFLIDLGYTYQLQKEQSKATKQYEAALEKIKENPNYVYSIAVAFENKTLLTYALQAYEIAKTKNSNLSFDYQIALLYGQLGDYEKMIDALLKEAYNKPDRLNVIQYHLSRYISEDVDDVFKNQLKRILLLNAQKQQDIFWNQFLSWYFIQNKEFGKAFTQQKAIVKRSPELFSDMVDLVYLAIDENDTVAAQEIATFILNQTITDDLRLSLQQYVLRNELKTIQPANYTVFKTKIDALINQYGVSYKTVDLLVLSAHFEAFYLQLPTESAEKLKRVLELQINDSQQAKVKMELADILLYQEKFNQALIYYSQIENDLKNDETAHEASLRVAKTSYYKGDFDWALKQLKVLKASSSQLIANDALELYLLITDNNQSDSTHVALKKFAQADFKLYQKKYDLALELFQDLLKTHADDVITEVAYLRLGKIYENKNDDNKALEMYTLLLQKYPEGIAVDEALFFSAHLYLKVQAPEKAQPLFEKIILNHPDSIFFSEARQQFRQLRGDKQS